MSLTSIRVPDTISKLSQDDTYPIVQGTDVGGFSELKTEVESHTSKIETNIDNVNSLKKKGDTLVIKVVGDTPPDYTKTPYGNYVTIVRAMTKTLNIETPDPTGGMLDGAIFTVYNEDPTDAIMIRAGASSDSINGGSGINVPTENFASFVYQLADRNFLLLESGYIPAAKLNVANYVEQKLSADDKLHTTDEIKALVGSGGTSNGVSVIVNDKTYADTTELEFEDFTAVSDPSTPHKVSLTPKASTSGSGIEFDDGTTQTTEVTKVTTSNMGAFSAAPHEVSLEPYVVMSPQAAGSTPTPPFDFNKLKIRAPLTAYADPDVTMGGIMEIERDAFEEQQAPSMLSYVSDGVKVLGKATVGANQSTFENKAHNDGKLWFGDVVKAPGAYIQTDMTNKTYGIQEADGGDPNITGGQDYLVSFRVAMEGAAPSDGWVAVYLYEGGGSIHDSDNYLKDVENHPLIAIHNYSKDDDLGEITLTGVVNTKGLTTFSAHVIDNMAGDINLKDRANGCTGLLIQALETEAKTGQGIVQYELDTGDRIRVSKETQGWVLNETTTAGEFSLEFDDEIKVFRQTKLPYNEVYYLVHNYETAQPCGLPVAGNADISLDSSVNKVEQGSHVYTKGEGALRFENDGDATITTSVNLSNSVGVDGEVNFWWATVSDDGKTYTKIPDSEGVFNVPAQSPLTVYKLPEFKMQGVKAGTRIALRSICNIDSGIKLSCVTMPVPSVTVDVKFKELQPDHTFSTLDMEQFDHTYPYLLTAVKDVANVSSVTFNLDIDSGDHLVVLGAIKELADQSIRPVKSLDWSYSNTSKTLTVSFGETVAAGRVTLGIYRD